MTDEKKTGVSFECTQKQRDNYIKAASGKKLGVWIQSILDAAVKQQKATGTKKKVEPTAMTDVKPMIDDDDGDSFGNR